MKLKLTYFDLDGGRAEAARIALTWGKVPFEDNRLPFPVFNAQQTTFPFHTVPVLQVDDATIAQSNAINRFVGKLAGLYPDDALQAAYCDEVLDAIEDISSKVVATFGLDEDAKKAAREKLAQGRLGVFVETFGQKLVASGGEYFADGRLTMADLRIFVWLRYLKSGQLDHISPDILAQRAPNLIAYTERMAKHPAIVEYYNARKAAAATD